MGTDTEISLMLCRQFYHEKMAGFSIPAAEHSTITSWGREHEVDAFRNMLRQFGKPKSLLAVVSDSWDIYNACDKLWGDQLRQEVIDSQAVVVIRPDSGVPEAVDVKCAEILAEKFGYTVNSKGYKVLNNVKIIQGDGVDYKTIPQVLEAMKWKGFSASNIGFGSGGALLQKLDRDTFEMGFKCNAIKRDGKIVPVFKDPITSKMKQSKSGLLDLVKNNGLYRTVSRNGFDEADPDSELEVYFENGDIPVDDNFVNIRGRVNEAL
jgi:nicotinamide phosphoribosyltransferase